MRLQHLALAVRDQQRAIAFYARFFRFDPSSARTYRDAS
jgi:catechol 2,3-dioxygenase-like lactoylglutathione lyase family enzyme